MPRTDSFVLDDREKILDFVGQVSDEMFEYISESSSTFSMFYKTLTHSDLGTFGKATKPNSLEKNILYYLTEKEMLDIENRMGKPFQTAHQSNIGLKQSFYDMVNLPNPRNVGETNDHKYLLNDFMDVYIVNENIKYFTSEYTKRIITKLGKEYCFSNTQTWNFPNLNVKLSDDKFTPIQLHAAVHGICIKEDEEFYTLRHHMFKGDTIILLCEKKRKGKNSLFILLEKNPVFFSLLEEINTNYVNYLNRQRNRLINDTTRKTNAVPTKKRIPRPTQPYVLHEDFDPDEVTRSQQSAWRTMLANEMMGYTVNDNEIFCPFTSVVVDFSKVGELFVASHIKGFSDPETTNEEKYDINNGLLLLANADALFDKHLITVDENKKLVFSHYISQDYLLINKLLLNQPLFEPILNDKRMEYLAYHREKFYEKEKLRKRA